MEPQTAAPVLIHEVRTGLQAGSGRARSGAPSGHCPLHREKGADRVNLASHRCHQGSWHSAAASEGGDASRLEPLGAYHAHDAAVGNRRSVERRRRVRLERASLDASRNHDFRHRYFRADEKFVDSRGSAVRRVLSRPSATCQDGPIERRHHQHVAVAAAGLSRTPVSSERSEFAPSGYPPFSGT